MISATRSADRFRVSSFRSTLAVLALASTGAASAATFTYSPSNGDTLWSTGDGWAPSGPVSEVDSRLTFVADNTTVLPDGLVNTNTVDSSGQFLLNALDLQGTGADGGTSVINIAHTAPSTGLLLLGEGPVINLNALNGAGGSLTYNISAPIQLGATDTIITGNGTATFNFSGGITAAQRATIFKTGSSTVRLGTTSVNNIDIGRNAEGGSIIMNAGSALTVGMGFENAELTVGFLQNVGGSSTLTATLDASETTSFTANVGTVRVGNMTQGTGGSWINAALHLGANNDITAGNRVIIGYSQSAFPQGAFQGTVTTADGGTTIIRSPRMTIGGNKARGQFVAGGGSTVTFTGIGGGRMNLEMGITGESGVAGSGAWGGTADFSNATFIGELGSVIIGQLQNSSGSATTTGTFTLGNSAANHLDVSAAGDAVVIGKYISGSGTATGTMTIGNLDATSVIASTDNGTAILLGEGGTGTQSNGTLHLNGGTLELRTAGAGIRGGTGTSTVNFNGTTLKVGADSVNWITGVKTASIADGGARIDTNGFAAGSDQIFSGTGGLTKLGTGTLTLTGASTFTGTTTVEGGVLAIAGGGKLASQDIVVLETAINLTIETAGALSHANSLSLAGGGVEGTADVGFLNLLADATVGGLVLDGVLYGEGTYGSNASTADHKFDEYFSGSGVLTVVPEPGVLGLLGLAAALGGMACLRRRS